ncbi:DinB family protein [Pseudoneobacillus sp. C159]
MNFELMEAIEILERTPSVVEKLLSGLSEGWTTCNEGDGTWNAIEVVGHLIEGEKNDWIPRLEIILTKGEGETFPPFERLGHLKNIAGKTLEQLIGEFAELRAANLEKLKGLVASNPDLEQTGVHPHFGVVRLRELLATWVVHDFTHLAQVTRVMAERYRTDVGPWVEYLGVLKNG